MHEIQIHPFFQGNDCCSILNGDQFFFISILNGDQCRVNEWKGQKYQLK